MELNTNKYDLLLVVVKGKNQEGGDKRNTASFGKITLVRQKGCLGAHAVWRHEEEVVFGHGRHWRI